MMRPKKARRKLTQEESDGVKAWKIRYMEIYERECDIHETVRAARGVIGMGNIEGACDMHDALLCRHERETEELCACP